VTYDRLSEGEHPGWNRINAAKNPRAHLV
jgi:hypothetical protein